MTYQESVHITAHIGRIIAECQPRISYTPADVARAKRRFTPADLAEMEELGLYRGDFETFYVIRRFLEDYGISDLADGDYLAGVFGLARRLDAPIPPKADSSVPFAKGDSFLPYPTDPKDPDFYCHFTDDPYLAAIPRGEEKSGEFLFTFAGYRKGEIFQYDMPDFDARLLLPRLGFVSRRIDFPALYEGNMPWVSACPSEIFSMRPDLPAAHGRVLVLGLGIGYYPFAIASLPQVQEIVVVEHAPPVIDLFRRHLLPHFPHREKITLVEADAFAYLEALPVGRFDFCYADIWEGAVDGAECYQKIKPQEERLHSTRFCYWIEKPIRKYLEEDKT